MAAIHVIRIRCMCTESTEEAKKLYDEFCAKHFCRFPSPTYPNKHTFVIDGKTLIFDREPTGDVTNTLWILPPREQKISPSVYPKGDLVMYYGSSIVICSSEYKPECNWYTGKHPNPVQWFADHLKNPDVTPYEKVMAIIRRDETLQEDIEGKIMRAIENLTEDQMESLAREGALPITGHYNIHILKPMEYCKLANRVHKETKFRLKVKEEFIWLRV